MMKRSGEFPLGDLGEEDEIIILVVEDGDADFLLMQKACERAGFRGKLARARDGVEAKAYLKRESQFEDREKFPFPTIMLLDLNMPKMNGFEVLEWLRKEPVLKRLPTFVLSASYQEQDVERAYDLGVNGYLVKPSTLEQLVVLAGELCKWCEFNCFAILDENGTGTRSGKKV